MQTREQMNNSWRGGCWHRTQKKKTKRAHLAEPVEDVVEEGEDGRARHFGHVVERLAAVVAHPAVRVEEAGQHRLHQLVDIVARVLRGELRKI